MDEIKRQRVAWPQEKRGAREHECPACKELHSYTGNDGLARVLSWLLDCKAVCTGRETRRGRKSCLRKLAGAPCAQAGSKHKISAHNKLRAARGRQKQYIALSSLRLKGQGFTVEEGAWLCLGDGK